MRIGSPSRPRRDAYCSPGTFASSRSSATDEVELHEIAEELDEDDLTVGRVELRLGGAAGIEAHGRGADGDGNGVARCSVVPGCQDAAADAAIVDHDAVALTPCDRTLDDVVVAHEPRDELGFRLRGDCERISDLLDLRVVHDDDPIRHRQRLFLVVRHVDEHQPELALEVPQLDAHAQLKQPVEVAERLVQEQRLGLGDEHAGECDPLLLAPGELPRLCGRRADRGRPSPARTWRASVAPAFPTPCIFSPNSTFWSTVRCGKSAKCWKTVVVGRLCGGRSTSDSPSRRMSAARRELVAADHPQRRRLPAARRAEQDDVLAVVDVQVEVVDGHRAAREHLPHVDEVEARPSIRGGGGCRPL